MTYEDDADEEIGALNQALKDALRESSGDEFSQLGPLGLAMAWAERDKVTCIFCGSTASVSEIVQRHGGGSGPIMQCSGCFQWYFRRGRRAARGRRNYCPDCGKAGVATRDAKRAQRDGTAKPRREK